MPQHRDKAIALQEQCLAQRQRLFGAGHPLTLAAALSLTTLYTSSGNYAKAEPLCLTSIKKATQSLGRDHTMVVGFQAALAALYEVQSLTLSIINPIYFKINPLMT